MGVSGDNVFAIRALIRGQLLTKYAIPSEYFSTLRSDSGNRFRYSPLSLAWTLGKGLRKRARHRLTKSGVLVIPQHPLPVFDEDGTSLGDYFADLVIENQLIVEIKACRAITTEHVAQLLGYLRSSRIEHGLLINFGAPKLEIRKYVLSDMSSDLAHDQAKLV